MIFFTRQLYQQYQPDSPCQEEAIAEWDRRVRFYAKYFKLIASRLPRSARRLGRDSFHDARVDEVHWNDHTLELKLDCRFVDPASKYRGKSVRLQFRGVSKRPTITKLKGNWWLYEELHLTSPAAFCVHILFDQNELEIEANEVIIETEKSKAK